MKKLQRRAKSSAPTAANTVSRISHYQSMLISRWQALPPRDQLALGVLLVFLLLFAGGYGGYSVHQAAKESKERYQTQIADYFWLRAQAGNIDRKALTTAAQDGETASPTSQVTTILNTSGISGAQVIATGDAVQLSFNNNSQAIVSAALAKLEQQGWQFAQLSIQQDTTTKAIQVQATLSS